LGVVLERRRAIAALLGDRPQAVKGIGRGQETHAGFELALRLVVTPQLPLRLAALQVVVEKVVVTRDRGAVVLGGLRKALLAQVDVAQERMEVRFLRYLARGLLSEPARVVDSVLGERLLCLVVGFVGRFTAAQRRRRGLIALAAELAARRKLRRRLPVAFDALMRRS
jgi:hypothetical protein